MTTFRTTRPTGLFEKPSKDADFLPLLTGIELRFLGKTEKEGDKVFLNVVAIVMGKTGWVREDHREEVPDVRPALNMLSFIKACFLAETTFNSPDSAAPWFVAADFVIARGLIETGLTNVGRKTAGSDATGPLQVTSAEWDDFLKSNEPLAKDFKAADSEADRDEPETQVFGAMFRMRMHERAISDLKMQKDKVGTKDDPFLPSYLDVFHAHLVGAEAAVAILNAQASDQGKAEKINIVLQGLLTDAQITAMADARDGLKGKITPTQTVADFVAVTSALLGDALKKALDLIKENTPEELPQVKQGEASWFDVAVEEEKKNIDEHNPAHKDIILDYFKATDTPRPKEILPWCGAFAAHCMAASNNPVPKQAAAAKSWKNWGTALPVASTDVPQGAVVVLSPSPGTTGTTGHVAFFVQFLENGKKVELLGGNQSDKLKRSAFPTSQIAAIQWIDQAPLLTSEQESAGVPVGKISQRAFDAIIAFEVSSPEHYEKSLRSTSWPGFSSGVTIGVGYDVGQTKRAIFEADWKGVIPDVMLQALANTCGITGNAAHSLANQLKNTVNIPFAAASQVYAGKVIPRWVKVVEDRLENTNLLSPDSLGALVSLTLNRGGGGYTRSEPRFAQMRQIKALMKAKQFDAIPAQFRAMKPLWPATSGLPGRRDKEAQLFQDGLAKKP